MTRKEKIEEIRRVLNGLYPNPEVPLSHHDPFTLLVATVLSAQCTDKRVNEVTPALFRRADTACSMAQLSVEQLAELIRPVGLVAAKSKALAGLSRILCEKYGGEVPRTFDELEALPGVGHKTASVVMAQAFGEPAFPVDTHIHRLAARWGLSSGKNVVETERDLKASFPRAEWHKVHLQMIFFGREWCRARGHDAQDCPICRAMAPLSRRRRTADG